MRALEVDDARLSDLSLVGAFGLAIIAGGVVFAADMALSGDLAAGGLAAGVLALFGFALAYDDATPECDATCDKCGAHVRSNASRDGVDEYLEVHASGSPRRVSLGPLSAVKERQTITRIYCSGECAAADDRVLLERDGERLEPVETSESDHREGVA